MFKLLKSELKLMRMSVSRPRSGAVLGRLSGLGHLYSWLRILASDRPKKQPVLIVSIPRGGSSWVGTIVGGANDCVYLREPLTQGYKVFDPDHAAFFELDVCSNRRAYLKLGRMAFTGFSGWHSNIANQGSRWNGGGARSKRLVVKEVNPLSASALADAFDLKVVYLVRHPAAVASSMYSKRWTANPFTRKFTSRRLELLKSRYQIPESDDYWALSGAIQAVSQSIALDALRSRDAVKIVTYEDLCLNPLIRFKEIFDYCGIPFGEAERSRIESTTKSEGGYEIGTYDTVRNSKQMVDKWRSNIDSESLRSVKKWYLGNSPEFYKEDVWW